jgi:hypothetical protein
MEFLLVLAILLLGFMWSLPFVNEHRSMLAIKEVAARYHLQSGSTSSGVFSRALSSQVTGIHRGERISICTNRRSWGPKYPNYVERFIQIEVTNDLNARLMLSGTVQRVALLSAFVNKPKIPTNNPQFDRYFVIEQSVPKDLAKQLLASGSLRQRLLETLRGMRRMRIELQGRQLKLTETMPWYHLASLRNEADYLQRLADLAIDLGKAIEAVAS